MFSKKKDEHAKTPVASESPRLHALHAVRGKAARRVVLRPHLTEKAMRLAENRSYVFIVEKNATKTAVKNEVSRRWRVKVEAVRMMRTRAVVKRRGGRILRKRPSYKKAIVTLREGEKIELAS